MLPLKTFIVEDSPLIRTNLIATLEELAGVVVVGTAEDEATALEWLGNAEHAVDLVTIDIFLKTGSGLGVLRYASELPRSAKLVVLTNYATADMRKQCLALGAAKVFDKSTELETLIRYCLRLGSGEPIDSGSGVLV